MFISTKVENQQTLISIDNKSFFIIRPIINKKMIYKTDEINDINKIPNIVVNS